jgi:hypothetical protein
MSFNRIVGRSDPIRNYGGEYPYIIAENARIRQLDSLIQRNAAHLYPNIADPFGQNPLGDFNSDALGAPATTPATDTTNTNTDYGNGSGDGDPNPDGSGAPPPGTDSAGKRTVAYDNVTQPFCLSYVNIPYWSWKFSQDQQVGLSLLQERGDNLFAEYYSNNTKWPPEASNFALPTSIPLFSKYELSDRQMMYQSLYRPPDKFPISDPAVQDYSMKWYKAWLEVKSQISLSLPDEWTLLNYCKSDIQTMPKKTGTTRAGYSAEPGAPYYITRLNLIAVKSGKKTINDIWSQYATKSLDGSPGLYVAGTVNTLHLK